MIKSRGSDAGNHRLAAAKNSAFTALSLVAAITALGMTSACGGSERGRDYSVPSNLCGTPVSSDEISPFLPAGESITVQKEDHLGTEICKVVVDKKLALIATQAWVAKEKTTAYFASGQTLKKVSLSSDSGRYRYSGNEGFGKVEDCVNERRDQELYTALQFQTSENNDPDAMKRLITAYTAAVKDSGQCTISTS
ncbi:hypothetical protein OHA99_09685 [Streptomyces coelicoflavus]|uniref:hypothetical protein n=1 Tax=Streptomyces coelicoflavus TaxID=285562 RepID=UPI0032453B24